MDNRQRHYLSRSDLHQPSLWFVMAMVVVAVVAVGGLLFDDRVITGAPAWAKPLKFALSFILYSGALAVLLPMLKRGKRAGWWLGTVLVLTSVIEMVAIVGQVIRGRASHFNVSNEFDGTVYSVMGTTVGVLWVATFLVAILLWRNVIADRAVVWAVRLSMFISLGGMATGFLMTQPKPGQITEDAPPDVVGAHSIGVTDGGPGLPVLGWSTTGGDLRIAHFVGMHALQVLPVVAVLLSRWARRWPRLARQSSRVRLIAVLSAGHAGLTGLVLWQALRGEPLTSPGPVTIAAGVVLIAAVVAGGLWALRGRSRPTAVVEPETRPSIPVG